MRFLSICSGIEAASVAFHPLGWEALAFAEIEPFPCRLLAHHYPQVPNLGDLTRWREWSPELLAQVEVLCGGTPCQAFSVAGLRGSLSDERGNLTLTFCHLFNEIDRLRHLHGRPPAVCLWENVPGVLNTDDNAFGHFLAGLAGEDEPLTPPGARWSDAGYVRGPRRAIAWRTLDAQYFGLAQRRERVFVVASADPAFHPEQVLFELDSLRRDTPPSRGPGEGVARGFETGPSGGQFTNVAPTLDTRCKDGPIRNQLGLGVAERMTNGEGRMRNIQEVAGTLGANGKAAGSATQQDAESGLLIPLAFGGNNTSGPIEQAPALNANRGCHNPGDFEAGTLLLEQVCAPLTGNAWADNASEESKRVPEPLPFDTTQITSAAYRSKPKAVDPCHPMSATAHAPAVAFNIHSANSCAMLSAGPAQAALETEVARAVDTQGFTANQGGTVALSEVAQPLRSNSRNNSDPAMEATMHMLSQSPSLKVSPSGSQWRVRRLTPEECEILQGFPVGYTLIPGTSSKQRKADDLTDTIDYLISLGLPRAEAEVLAHAPDGPRYKALGNSWAVPVARWIARRIETEVSRHQ